MPCFPMFTLCGLTTHDQQLKMLLIIFDDIWYVICLSLVKIGAENHPTHLIKIMKSDVLVCEGYQSVMVFNKVPTRSR